MNAMPPRQDSLDIAALDATPVASDPFAHVVVPGFVPPAFLARIRDDMPEFTSGGSYPPESLKLGPAAASLVSQMQGPALRQSIAAKFGLDLDDAPVMLTLRGRTRDKDGRIHTDSVAKRVTVLLYLNPQTDAWEKQEGCSATPSSSTTWPTMGAPAANYGGTAGRPSPNG